MAEQKSKGGFALGYGGLSSLHFLVGNVLGVLGEGGGANDEEARRCDGYYVLGDFHKSHLFFLSLCIRAIRVIRGLRLSYAH